VGSGAAGELAACGGFTIDGLSNFVEADAEHVMEKKGSLFERRQSLQRHHQRQRHVVDLILLRLDNRFRQPGSDIGLASAPR